MSRPQIKGIPLSGGLITNAVKEELAEKYSTDLVNASFEKPGTLSLRRSLGVNIDPFLMAVAVGASCAFLTPIGHQCNALILGPGGYKFSDYWKMGLPLEIIIVLLGTPLILYFWPL